MSQYKGAPALFTHLWVRYGAMQQSELGSNAGVPDRLNSWIGI